MIIILLIIAVVIFFIYKSKNNNSPENTVEKQGSEKEHKILKQISKEFNNAVQNSKERDKQELIKKSKSIYYRSPSNFLMFDDEKKTISFNKGTFNYSQITGGITYINVDDKKAKGVGGAALGAVITAPFGGPLLGAVVGGLARRGIDKSKFKSCGVKIKVSGKIYDIRTSKSSDKNTKGKKIDKSNSINSAIDDAEMIGAKLKNILG
ncbi:hypothetical protein [Leuconostoc suionicum]|uniref:hypothetical protein n=1 Tax=Leuconostoc suionicum TaxID=1511761 RepID=UPI0032DFE647